MQEYHLLKVDNAHGSKTYLLNAPTVIIGRDTTSGIKINDSRLSPHHAVLRRLPSDSFGYSYMIILIEGTVNICRNGVFQNSSSVHKLLDTGDVLQIGSTRLSYLIASMTPEEYRRYFDAQPIIPQNEPVGHIAA